MAWNWDVGTIILITTQDTDEGHTLMMLGENAGKSLGPFEASKSILNCLFWDFFYTWEYSAIFLMLLSFWVFLLYAAKFNPDKQTICFC